MLDGAREQPCVNCGVSDGTVVAAHYTGMRAHWMGKGTAHKVSDLFVADLCQRCHSQFDLHTKEPRTDSKDDFAKKIDLSEQFLFLVVKTLSRRVDQKIISVKGYISL